MQNSRGEKLLSDLFEDPEGFERTQVKGYDLLNEYLRGFDIETLIPVLESDKPLINRVGISICSELDEDSCGYLLPDLLALLEKEEDPLYLHYLLSGIFKGTYGDNQGQFAEVIRMINSAEYKVCASAMKLIAIANNEQLSQSILSFRNSSGGSFEKGLSYLIKSKDLSQDSIKELILSDDKVLQLFGGIIALKLYDQYPDLIVLSTKSSNSHLSKFSNEVLDLKK